MDDIEIKVHKIYDLDNKPYNSEQVSVKDEGCCCKTLEQMREHAKEQGLKYVTLHPSEVVYCPPITTTPVCPVENLEEEIGKYLSEEELEEYLRDTGQKPLVSMEQKIIAHCDEIKSILLLKNKCYGNSASEPIRVFSKSDPLEQMRVRIDDKLSRIMRGTEYPGDDTILDLIGYLVLYRILKEED